MKNYIAAIVIIVFFICPSICFSSYLIELKNGSTFITNHYWKEGRQIKFYYYGGVVGIPKNFVKAIRKWDIAYKEGIDSLKNVLQEKGIKYDETAEIDESRPKLKDSGLKNKLSEDKLNTYDYKNKKISLVVRLKNQQKKLERDISRGKVKMWIERRRRKIKDIKIEIDNLAKEIMEKNNGILPDWWHEIAIPEQSVTQ
jgi:hypothetical protein